MDEQRVAAMEPALDERGDATRAGVSAVTHGCRNGARSRRAGRHLNAIVDTLTRVRPQWSPLSTSGATQELASQATALLAPQWSPLSTSGATRHGRQDGQAGRGAAMEPALDERGDTLTELVAAGSLEAAMEPALDERGDRSDRAPTATGPRRRNGARSRRAGRRCRPTRSTPGLGCRNGARSRRAGRLDRGVVDLSGGRGAAMEPALDERGDFLVTGHTDCP